MQQWGKQKTIGARNVAVGPTAVLLVSEYNNTAVGWSPQDPFFPGAKFYQGPDPPKIGAGHGDGNYN